ncbi:MAG: hypothetical protein ACRCXD_15035 [Luteolibacter sp.]
MEISDFDYEVVNPYGPDAPSVVLARAVKLNLGRLIGLGFLPTPPEELMDLWPTQGMGVVVPRAFAEWLERLTATRALPYLGCEEEAQEGIVLASAAPSAQIGI